MQAINTLSDVEMAEATATVAQPVRGTVAMSRPVRIEITAGLRTATERKLEVLSRASGDARMFAVGMKGKIGAAARTDVSVNAIDRAGFQAACGNFRPAAEILALILGESVAIKSGASFDGLRDALESRAHTACAKAKNGGYREDKKTGVMVPAGQNATFRQALAALDRIMEIRDREVARRLAKENGDGSGAQ